MSSCLEPRGIEKGRTCHPSILVINAARGRRSNVSARGSTDATLLREQETLVELWPRGDSRLADPAYSAQAIERSAASGLSAAEVRRRLCHMLPGILAFVMPLVPHERPLPAMVLLRLICLATILTTGVILVRPRLLVPSGRRELRHGPGAFSLDDDPRFGYVPSDRAFAPGGARLS